MNGSRLLCRRRSRRGSRSDLLGRRLRRDLCNSGLDVERTQVLAHLIGDLVFNGARVRALVRYPELREKVQDRPTLHFQFARQIVDPNLTHFTPLFCVGLEHGR